jgi:hypothetical protein
MDGSWELQSTGPVWILFNCTGADAIDIEVRVSRDGLADTPEDVAPGSHIAHCASLSEDQGFQFAAPPGAASTAESMRLVLTWRTPEGVVRTWRALS